MKRNKHTAAATWQGDDGKGESDMHIVAQSFANDDDDRIGAVWADYREGRITRDELITKQDTILIERGQVCQRCNCRAIKAIVAGVGLCNVCFQMQTRRAA